MFLTLTEGRGIRYDSELGCEGLGLEFELWLEV